MSLLSGASQVKQDIIEHSTFLVAKNINVSPDCASYKLDTTFHIAIHFIVSEMLKV